MKAASTCGRIPRLGLFLPLALHLPALAADTNLRAGFERAMEEFEQAQPLRRENPDQAKALLLSAAQRLESLAAAGIVNGRLEYNIGNCYLQAGDVGRAILHYRRAERLTPRDPYLDANLEEARSRRLVQIPPRRSSSIARSAFFWHYQTSTAERTTAALVLYAAFWALLAVRLATGRRWAAVATGAAGIATLALACSVAVSHWTDRNAPPGVVLVMDVGVYNGPGESYERRYKQPLQPGVEFTLRQRRGSWWHIELPDSQRGWIERESAELVPRART